MEDWRLKLEIRESLGVVSEPHVFEIGALETATPERELEFPNSDKINFDLEKENFSVASCSDNYWNCAFMAIKKKYVSIPISV